MTFPDNNEKKERLEQNVKALSIWKKKLILTGETVSFFEIAEKIFYSKCFMSLFFIQKIYF